MYADGTNSRITGAVVQLCVADGRMVEERTTRSLGEFTFAGLAPGVYILKATAEGYEPAEFKPDVRMTSNQSFTIYMKSEQMNVVSNSTASTVSAHVLSMPRRARELYQSGMKKLYVEKNAQAALQDFQKAVQHAPKFYEAELQSGMALLSLGKGPEAEVAVRKSLELSDDKFADGSVVLGVLLFDRADMEGAQAQFHQALELSPSNWIACYKLGEISYRRGELAEAETWAKKAKQLETDLPMMDQLLMEIHLKEKNYPAAIQDIDAYLENDPISENADRMRELQEKLKGLAEK